MADLPSVPTRIVTSQAPQSSISPGQVEAPYTQLAGTLDKVSGALNDIAIPFAERAGYEAVTRDADGRIQVARAPIIGPAAAAFERAAKVAAVAQTETAAQRDDIGLRSKFKNDPQGYIAAAQTYRDTQVAALKETVGPEAAFSAGRAIDQTQTATYSGLVSTATAVNAKRDDTAISVRIEAARNDAAALARGGDTSSPAFVHASDTVMVLTNERVKNPALAYPQAQADYEIQNFQGTLSANAFLHRVDGIYNNKGVGPDGQALGGKARALEAAERLRTDPTLRLSESQREAYFHKASAEINANEALRTQAVSDARAAAQELNLASASGLRIDPTDVDRVANAFKAAGAPGDAARLYSSFIRKPLNDDFGKQPLAAQTRDIQQMTGSIAAKTGFDFFVSRGYTPEQAAGVMGNLAHESGLDPTALGDGGTSGGLAQFHNERLTALRAFAKERGTAPTNFRTQLEFIDHELRTTEGRTLSKLQAARTPEEAAHAFLDYERPKGWTRENPAGGMGYGSRVAIARSMFDTANGKASGSPLGAGPSTSAWLTANRTRTLDTAVETSWATVQKAWNEKQIRPADAVVNGIADAARLSRNSHLLDTIASDMDRIARVQAAGQESLPTQAATIAEMSRLGSTGGLSPGDSALLKQRIQRRDAIQSGLDDNPIATTLANFGDKLRTPAPLNIADPEQFSAGLQQRAGIVGFAARNWDVPARSALDAADVQQVKAALASPDPAVKVQIFRGIATLPEDIRGATLSKLGNDGIVGATEVFAGSMITAAPEISAGILTGLRAADVDKRLIPSEGASKATYLATKDTALPMSAFNLAARSNPTGALAVMSNAIDARYASLSAQAGDTSGAVDRSRLRKAAEDVTGGILYHVGGPLIAPARGMDQRTFDGILSGITDNDLKGVTTKNGAPISADYLRNSAKLHSLATGRYLVQVNADAANPLYAQGPNGKPFVLDLRGRTAPGPAVQSTLSFESYGAPL